MVSSDPITPVHPLIPRASSLAFVLAGIPVYYITQRQDGQPTAVQGKFSRESRTDPVDLIQYAAFFSNLLARIRGRPDTSSGWQAVATEGDEQLEMRTPVR